METKNKGNNTKDFDFDFSNVLDSDAVLNHERKRELAITKEKWQNTLRHKAQLGLLMEKARMCKVREQSNAFENCREFSELFSLLKLTSGGLDRGIFYRPPQKEK